MAGILENLIWVSGGQTGADRAALDFAIANNLPHRGWCPKGRKAEDGPLNKKYNLTETPSENYEQRTEWNVRDADVTLIFSMHKQLSGGTLYTRHHAQKLNKPYLHIYPKMAATAAEKIAAFLNENDAHSVNVAGPRASKEPLVYEFVTEALNKLLAQDAQKKL